MIIKTGCDLVELKKFKKSLERGGPKFVGKIFTATELSKTKKTESLAGIFAAKEATIKALGLKAGDWQKIEIIKNKKGSPELNILESEKKIMGHDLSISHDGEYVMAVAVFLF